MKVQKRTVKGTPYFVCQYTGALIQTRFFVPVGKYARKERAFATLPVCLRSIFEEEGEKTTEKYTKIKAELEAYFHQPDIPMQQKLPLAKRPLSEDELIEYLEGIDCGAAWLLVPGGQECQPSKKRKVKQ